MFIHALQRHLAVNSIQEVPRTLKTDRDFWNVISIRDPLSRERLDLRGAKRVHEVRFDDLEDATPSSQGLPPRAEHIGGLLEFADAYPGEPMLIHCVMGISRSSAAALVLIVRGLVQGGEPDESKWAELIEEAVHQLLLVRPVAGPNLLVLRLGLERLLSTPVAADLAQRMVFHPRLQANRLRRFTDS